MKNITNKLGRQLLTIFILNFCIIVIFLGTIIPYIIKYKYEGVIYDRLKSQINELDEKIDDHVNIGDTIYIYSKKGKYYMSPNIYKYMTEEDCIEFISRIDEEYGNIKYNKHTYYYYKYEKGDVLKIALIDGSFVIATETAILNFSLILLMLVYFGVSLIILFWSNGIVRKIKKIKDKIDNIDNPDYQFKPILGNDDELKALDSAIDDMRISLLKQEELRTQLYQNISHDFKTPLTVIKSYIEAVEDGVEEQDKALDIILQQTNKLESKVHSLLYLNKLDYLKDENYKFSQRINIKEIIDLSIEKFKHRNNEVKIIKNIDKNAKFYGTEDIWETIIDNILNNFYRYAVKEIKITIKNNKIILYNDGPNIKDDFLDAMFVPFRKGIKGEFGLGLSIVRKSLIMIGYEIEVKNHNKKGVSFIISKKGSK